MAREQNRTPCTEHDEKPNSQQTNKGPANMCADDVESQKSSGGIFRRHIIPSGELAQSVLWTSRRAWRLADTAAGSRKSQKTSFCSAKTAKSARRPFGVRALFLCGCLAKVGYSRPAERARKVDGPLSSQVPLSHAGCCRVCARDH